MSSEGSHRYQFEVSSAQHGMRLLQFLRDNLEGKASVKAIKRSIESKKCSINNQLENFSTRILSVGDKVVISLEVETSSLKLEILYEDESLVAVNKPAGVICDSKAIGIYFPKKRNDLLLVHRLDKETSGVLLFAKDESILKTFIELFRGKEVSKTYYAIVDGIVEKEGGTIKNLLDAKVKYEGQTTYGSSKTGKVAVTEWECIKKGKKESLVKCHPITGRTHQLRVHLSEMGHAILGDVQYCKTFKSSYKPSRHLLHAFEINFIHPLLKKKISIKAPFPHDFIQALENLGLKKNETLSN